MRPVVDILRSADRHIGLLSSLVKDANGYLTYDCGMHYWNGAGVTTPIHTNILEELRDDGVIQLSEGKFIDVFLPVWLLAQGHNPIDIFPMFAENHSDLGDIENPSGNYLILVTLWTGHSIPTHPQQWKTYISDFRWQIL